MGFDQYRQNKLLRLKLTKHSYSYSLRCFFWMDKENFDFPHLVMNGHDGQRVIINFKTGAILSMHAIRNNFNQTEIEELLFD